MPLAGSHVPHIAVLGATREEIAALPLLEGVVWILCKPISPGIHEFWRDDLRLAQVDFTEARWDLPELIAIVGRADDATFKLLKVAWAERLAAKALIFLPAPDLAPATVMAAAIEALSERLIAQQVHCARFALDLATYRDEFDRLEYGFAALEAYVIETGIETPRALFSYPVGAGSVDLASYAGEGLAQGADRTLAQVLPVNSIGVSGMEICLSSVPPQGSPSLGIRLRIVETGKIAAIWRLDPAETRVGWTSLRLDRAIDEIALTLVLEITWPADRPGWRVDLGAPNPNPIMCARPGNARPLPAPIAMRILGSVPGMMPKTVANLVPPAAPRHPSTIPVPLSAYESVTTIGGDAAEGISLVVYDQDAAFIQVHPNGPGTVTVAQIIVMPQIPAWRLSAHIHLAHENANLTDFGILVREEGEPLPDFADLAKDMGGQPGFSGWHSLAPLEHGALSVLLPSLSLHGLNVFLLTKQTGTHEFAWARFSDLRLHLGPPSPPLPDAAP
jgi:hypothetical protein